MQIRALGPLGAWQLVWATLGASSVWPPRWQLRGCVRLRAVHKVAELPRHHVHHTPTIWRWVALEPLQGAVFITGWRPPVWLHYLLGSTHVGCRYGDSSQYQREAMFCCARQCGQIQEAWLYAASIDLVCV